MATASGGDNVARLVKKRKMPLTLFGRILGLVQILREPAIMNEAV